MHEQNERMHQQNEHMKLILQHILQIVVPSPTNPTNIGDDRLNHISDSKLGDH